MIDAVRAPATSIGICNSCVCLLWFLLPTPECCFGVALAVGHFSFKAEAGCGKAEDMDLGTEGCSESMPRYLALQVGKLLSALCITSRILNVVEPTSIDRCTIHENSHYWLLFSSVLILYSLNSTSCTSPKPIPAAPVTSQTLLWRNITQNGESAHITPPSPSLCSN